MSDNNVYNTFTACINACQDGQCEEQSICNTDDCSYNYLCKELVVNDNVLVYGLFVILQLFVIVIFVNCCCKQKQQIQQLEQKYKQSRKGAKQIVLSNGQQGTFIPKNNNQQPNGQLLKSSNQVQIYQPIPIQPQVYQAIQQPIMMAPVFPTCAGISQQNQQQVVCSPLPPLFTQSSQYVVTCQPIIPQMPILPQ
ncbi:Hypothetical_protein [Hexamita inflata]|uniref:Hypothetical_protein n=1 Tax=Hexamita inflata TaxID=28002 RepID=A0AA86QXI6_9EUKA|nr:Hypothetical protein HINF_LOCUS50242 [Hexamita inflata]